MHPKTEIGRFQEPRDFLILPLDRLAQLLLRHLNEHPGDNTLAGLIRPMEEQGPFGNNVEVFNAITEGWAWLITHDLIAQEWEDPNSKRVFVTRRGRQSLSENWERTQIDGMLTNRPTGMAKEVSMTTKRATFKRGERVMVRFGINDFSGVVVRFDATLSHPSVLVALDQDDDESEQYVSTFPAENVTSVRSHRLASS